MKTEVVSACDGLLTLTLTKPTPTPNPNPNLEDGGGVGVRGLALGQLDRRDTEGPQVHLVRGRGGVRVRVRVRVRVGVIPRDHRSTW